VDDGKPLDRHRDAEAALEHRPEHRSARIARGCGTGIVAGLAMQAVGAADDLVNDLALERAAIEVGRRLVITIEEWARRSKHTHRQTLTQRLNRIKIKRQ
jgi:hypothetical protein